MNPFTELDLEKLKVITRRWVKQMQLQDGWFEEVTLHRYAAPHFRERTSLQYAVVFIHVYRGCPPNNWTEQWLFVPLFKDCLLPDQIQTDESVVLYSRRVATLNEILKAPMRDLTPQHGRPRQEIDLQAHVTGLPTGYYVEKPKGVENLELPGK